jgi:hypothetical protein
MSLSQPSREKVQGGNTLNGNQESSEESEKSSKEKETLTNNAGRRPR